MTVTRTMMKEAALKDTQHALDGRLRSLLARLEEELSGLYGERYRGLVLYGSHARGEAEAGSDVDLLLILDGEEEEVDPVAELRRVHPLKWPLALQAGYTVAIVPVSRKEYLGAERAFLHNVRREGISVP